MLVFLILEVAKHAYNDKGSKDNHYNKSDQKHLNVRIALILVIKPLSILLLINCGVFVFDFLFNIFFTTANVAVAALISTITTWVIIVITVPNTGSFNLVKDGDIVPFTDWDEDISNYAAVQGKFCGENRYVGVENFFEFYITPGCTIEIIPRDAIQSYVRLEWTLDEFYADGGVVSFADRVAAALGIHASEIKTVAVYEGSVVVEFYIEADYDACEIDEDEIERKEYTDEEVEDKE